MLLLVPLDAAAEHTALGSRSASHLWFYHVQESSGTCTQKQSNVTYPSQDGKHLGSKAYVTDAFQSSLALTQRKGEKPHLAVQSLTDMGRLGLHHRVEQGPEICLVLLTDSRAFRDG